MARSNKQTNSLAVVVCAAMLAGMTMWARSRKQRAKLLRKQLTNLRFDVSVPEIKAETERILARMKRVDDEIAALQPSAVKFESSAQKLIDLDHEMLSRVTNVTFLGQVSDDKAIRDACTKAYETIEDYAVQRSMRADVYKAIRTLYKSQCYQDLDSITQRYVCRLVQDFERNGLQLPEEKRKELQSWKQKLSKLEIQFQQNLSEETINIKFSDDDLKGVSDDFIAALQKNDDGMYMITLSYPTVFPILNTCTIESTRKAVEFAFNRRCISTNVAILEEMLKIRHKAAVALGFDNHASYVLEHRMAKTPEDVNKFLNDLNSQLEPLAKKDLDDLLKLKKADCERNGWKFDGKINMWDFRFYMDQYLKKHCLIDTEEIREYFPLAHVTAELLSMYQEILSLKFEEISQPHVWHKDVRMFKVSDARLGTVGNLVGYFYLDLFPRAGKYGHAACFTLQQSCTNSAGVREYPVAAMVANFNAPTNLKPSLLSHDEVVTFFHEFGHVMHCLCSEVAIPRFAGTRVEQDFVEAPSQMLENWCWEKESLQRLSSHNKTNAKLSDEYIARLISTKNVTAGLSNKRQLLFAMFDQSIHSRPNSDTAHLLKQLQKDIMLIDMTPDTNFAASFNHLACGYDAQYYGYMWSEVFSMDMFMSRFKKEGLMNSKTGLAYRELILARGGSIDACVMLEDFLGRAPNQDAFLRSKGLTSC